VTQPARPGSGVWRLAAPSVVLLLLPIAVFVFLHSSPEANQVIRIPTAHAIVVTFVSLLAVALAALIARAALQLDQYRIFLVTLGFLALGGLFAVHAFATPGILLHGPGIHARGALYGEDTGFGGYGSPAPSGTGYDDTIIGLSAFLSLFIPALFFAFAFTPAARTVSQRRGRASGLLVAAVTLLFLYGVEAVLYPEYVVRVIPSRPPFTTALALVSSALLIFSAVQLARTHGRTRLPMHGALALAMVLLAEAQMVMVVETEFWSLAWWEYHVLMLAAVVISLGAIFVELDRRRGLERFVSSAVVERLVAGQVPKAAGERRVLTILFADLRGSTALADELPVEEVVEVINSYVSAIARSVLEEGGAVDKFIGDGLMAIFGLKPDESDGAVPAARAARGILRSLRALSQERSQAGKPALDFGVAINTGDVILTALGLSERADFTAIGDTVNTTSRLEGLCKEFSVNIVVSASTAERLGRERYDLEPLGEANVRGKREAMQLFTLRMRELPGGASA
jgi:class 3 adenylate cyclase